MTRCFCDGCDKEIGAQSIIALVVRVEIARSNGFVSTTPEEVSAELCSSCFEQLRRKIKPRDWVRAAAAR